MFPEYLDVVIADDVVTGNDTRYRIINGERRSIVATVKLTSEADIIGRKGYPDTVAIYTDEMTGQNVALTQSEINAEWGCSSLWYLDRDAGTDEELEDLHFTLKVKLTEIEMEFNYISTYQGFNDLREFVKRIDLES